MLGDRQVNPSQYYYGKFRNQFGLFFRSLERNGSCSRARAHQRQEFWGHRLGSPITNALNADGSYFSVGDLFASQHFPDHLADVPKEDRVDFLCALFYTVLIDQVIYTHHNSDYTTFRKLTLYPKMDSTIGWARPMMMANPYEVFGKEVLEPRGLEPEDILVRLEPWAQFIISDLRNFFDEHEIGTTNWPILREAILSDRDCIWGAYGSVLRRRLLDDKLASEK